MRGKNTGGQKVFYSGYLKAEGKLCSKCQVLRVLSDFSRHKGSATGLNSWCRACENQQSAIYRRKNRKKINEWMKTHNKKTNGRARKAYEARLGKEELNYRKKLQKAKREERLGTSDFFRQNRTREGKLIKMQGNIAKKYGIKCTVADVRERFLYYRPYTEQFAEWEASGFRLPEAPVPFPKNVNKKPVSLRDLTIVRYGYVRSCATKKAWSNGTYDNRRVEWERKRNGLQQGDTDANETDLSSVRGTEVHADSPNTDT